MNSLTKRSGFIMLMLALTCCFCPAVSAQFDTGGQNNGGQGTGTDTGGQGNAGGEDAASGANGLRTADDAFSNVERGDSVGSTAGTGASFSDVGVDANGGGGLGGGLGGFGGGFGGFGGLGGIFGNQGAGGGQSTQPAIRTRLRSAIRVSPVSPVQTQRRVNQHLSQVSPRAGMQGVDVYIEGDTAIVTGTVSSERERRMSELLMRLEPGVRNVENRTRVVQPAPGF